MKVRVALCVVPTSPRDVVLAVNMQLPGWHQLITLGILHP